MGSFCASATLRFSARILINHQINHQPVRSNMGQTPLPCRDPDDHQLSNSISDRCSCRTARVVHRFSVNGYNRISMRNFLPVVPRCSASLQCLLPRRSQTPVNLRRIRQTGTILLAIHRCLRSCQWRRCDICSQNTINILHKGDAHAQANC